MKKNILILLIVLLSLAGAFAYAQDCGETAIIQDLIASVERLEGATFVRNGKAYDARSASGHLQLKLRHAGDRVKTAEDFITFCGSKSSITGQPYLIIFADGTTVKAEAFFRRKLRTIARDRP
jgi:hypothetical protein